MAHYRSPSPSHGRLQSHCNSRILETASDRRLHVATLATSPSLKNHPVRSSFELMKENDRESIYAGEVVTARPKSSPAASIAAASKNGKNFMSPTISASSKAVGPSPRRKILGERNQDLSSVRSSVESIGSLARSSVESLPSMAPVVMPAKPALHDEAHQGSLQKASGRREDAANHAPVGVDQTLNDRVADDPHTPASAIAPLDADPTLPPYDPETNFLSPRPRFLFYRPKPPQEMLESDHEEDQLSDDAPSDKSEEEDADGQEKSEARKSLDLSDSFEDVKEEEITEKHGEATASIDKPDVAAHEEGEAEADLSDKFQEEKEEEEAQVPTAASVDDSSPPLSVDDDAVVNESLLFPELTKPHSVAPSAPPKPRSFFSRSKALPLIMIAALLLACCTIPLTNTPAMPSPFPSFPPFHSPALKVIDNFHLRDHLRRAAEFADTNLRELASVLHHWSADAYAQLPGWALFTTQVEDDDGWFMFTNFTAALFHEEEDLDFLLGGRSQERIKDAMDDGAYSPEESEESGEEDIGVAGEDNEEINDVEGGLSVTAEVVKEEDGLTVEKVAAVMATAEEEVTASKDFLESYGQVVDDGVNSEVKEEGGEFLEEGTTTDLPSPSRGEQGGGAAYPQETNAEPHPDQSSESPPTEVLDAGDSSDRLGVTEGVKEPSGSDAAADFARSLPEDGNKTVLAVSSFVVAVIAILVSFYYIKQKQASPAAAPQAVPAALPAAAEASRTADQSPLPEHLSGRAGFETVHPEDRGSVLVKHSVETIDATTPLGESKVEAVKEEEESVRIQDARARRDSTASSTTSFGSFTTLEKVSGKKGRSSKDKDEAMTPVRRSSRIRSHK